VPGRPGNGTSDLTIRILQQIRDEVRKANERLDETNERLERGFADLRGRIDVTNRRLDHLVEFAGQRYRGQTRAIRNLDRRVARLEQSPRAPR
jgi:hypothetical protein